MILRLLRQSLFYMQKGLSESRIFEASGDKITANELKNKALAYQAKYDDMVSSIDGLVDRRDRMRVFGASYSNRFDKIKENVYNDVKWFGENAIDTFYKNVGKKYNFEKDVKKPITTAFKNSDVIAKKVFQKYVPKDAVATWNDTEIYHQANKVYFNATKMLNDGRGIVTGYFHEFGHLIDHKASANYSLSMDNAKFGQLIRDDKRLLATDGCFRRRNICTYVPSNV